jgi:hypothetical protein
MFASANACAEARRLAVCANESCVPGDMGTNKTESTDKEREKLEAKQEGTDWVE